MLCTDSFFTKSDDLSNVHSFGPKCPLHFLIILSDDEFQQKSCMWFISKIDYLLQNARKFPGKIQIKKKSEISYETYSFESIPFSLNTLYVKMPKEKIYVQIQQFPEFFVYSQLLELGKLLLYLHAENVKITHPSSPPSSPIMDKLPTESNVSSPLLKYLHPPPSSHVSIVNIHPGVTKYLEIMGANHRHNCVEIHYDIHSMEGTIDEKHYFYFDKWKSMIDNKIQEKKYYDEFIYQYFRPCFLENEFLYFLKTAGVRVPSDEFEKSQYPNFCLHYEIFYYMDEMIEND